MHVAAIGVEIDDQVSDDLAGAVIGDVAAPAGFEYADVPRGQFLARGQDVSAAAVAADAERQDRRMFDKQKQIVDRPCTPLLDQAVLEGERLPVTIEPRRPEPRGGELSHVTVDRDS